METKNTGSCHPESATADGGIPRLSRKLAWFTLVELIVVITILVILGTIAFVSLSGYSESVRDGVRTTNASSLLKWLDISYVKVGTYPLPDISSINIMSGSTLIGYQWYVGSGIILRSKVSGDVSDPVDKTPFTYNTNVKQNKIQLLGFFENSASIALRETEDQNDNITPSIREQTFAATDYSKRYPFVKGQSLGIILSATGSTKNQPIQDVLTGSVDVGSGTVTSSLTAYINAQSGSVNGTGVVTVAPLYLIAPVTFPLTLSPSTSNTAYSSTPTDITSTTLSSFSSTPFTTPADYTSVGADDTNYKTTSITGGAGSATANINFNTSGNYTVQDGTRVEVSGGAGWLKWTGTGSVGTWNYTTSMNSVRYNFGSFAYGGYAYVIGESGWSYPTTSTERAPINASGSIGTFTQYSGVGATDSGVLIDSTDSEYAFAYNGWVYAMGRTTTERAPINSSGIGIFTQSSGTPGITPWVPNVRWNGPSFAYNGYVYRLWWTDNGWAPLTTTERAVINANGSLWVFIQSSGTPGVTPGVLNTGWRTSAFAYNGYVYVFWETDTSSERAIINADGSLGTFIQSSGTFGSSPWVISTDRSGLTAFWYNGYVYVLGGSNLTSTERAIVNADGSLWVFSLGTTNMHASRKRSPWFAYNGYLYIFGGSNWIYNTVEYAKINATYPTTTYSITTSTDQLSTSSWSSISSVTVTESKPTNTSIYYGVSFDNRNSFAVNTTGAWRSIVWNDSGIWKYNSNTTYGSTTWTACATNSQEACLSQAFGVTSNQMTGAQMQSISSGNWSTTGGFVAGTSTIDLAVGLSTTDSTVTPSVDNVAFTYGTAPRYASQLYTFNTSAYNVTSLTPSLVAFATANAGNGIVAKIWNANSNSWYTLASLGNTVSSMPAAASTQTINSSVSNYIDGSGIVRILASSVNPSTAWVAASLSTDLMQLIIDGSAK